MRVTEHSLTSAPTLLNVPDPFWAKLRIVTQRKCFNHSTTKQIRILAGVKPLGHLLENFGVNDMKCFICHEKEICVVKYANTIVNQ